MTHKAAHKQEKDKARRKKKGYLQVLPALKLLIMDLYDIIINRNANTSAADGQGGWF